MADEKRNAKRSETQEGSPAADDAPWWRQRVWQLGIAIALAILSAWGVYTSEDAPVTTLFQTSAAVLMLALAAPLLTKAAAALRDADPEEGL